MKIALVADCGSTKTDWAILLDQQLTQIATTQGFNPYFHDSAYIETALKQELLPQIEEHHVHRIDFYGAGCSAPAKNQIVKAALSATFPEASITVEHDLLAAARALCGHKAGIAAILGTGSNSCYYDGKQILECVGSHGYVLGDEGSGGQLGQKLATLYLRKLLPGHIMAEINGEHTPEALMEAVYSKPNPNRFLAGLAPYVIRHRSEACMQEIIRSSFQDFFTHQVQHYRPYRELPLNATGSIAFTLQTELKEVATGFGVQVGSIIKNPIEGLVAYHLQS